MHALYYWRPDNYRRDLDYGAGYHLNQSSPRLHDIAIGESLWAFTRNKSNRYVLAAELVVKARTFNARGFRYGEYRVWAEVVNRAERGHWLLRPGLEVEMTIDLDASLVEQAAAPGSVE